MHDAHPFLQNLTVVLCVAALTTVISQRLRQPAVFGYLVAGMIVGPYIPVPLAADPATVRTLSELGVVLLMFSLGLEFSIRKFLALGPTAGLIAVAQTSVLAWASYLLARAFGWTVFEALFAGAIFAISSTTIIAKAFSDYGLRGRYTQVVLGILICEDLIAIFFLAILTAVTRGHGISVSGLATTGIQLVTFLAALIGIGLLTVPRFIRWVVVMNRPETTLISSIGIGFASALTALAFGYSVALGAFIGGSLIAESGHDQEIELLVRPVRDIFAAIFFVSVGMLIEPRLIAEHWLPIVLFTVLVIVVKTVAVSISAFLVGYGLQTSIQAGMSLAQIGEFSFIIAGIGLASGATREFLYPVAVAVSAITTLTTPWLIRWAGPFAAAVDDRLPQPIQTFNALYGSWIENLRRTPESASARPRTLRLVKLLLLDAALITLVVVGGAVALPRFTATLVNAAQIRSELAQLIVIAAVTGVLIPLIVGLIRTARLLGLELALRAIPAGPEGHVDLGAAPRKALVVTLQLGIILLISIPLIAATQPFVPALRSVVLLAAACLLLASGFWRSATNLQGHARAGAEVIVAVLSRQMARPEQIEPGPEVPPIGEFLPGMGGPVPLRIPEDSPAAGRSLGQIKLRGLTGATVLAIIRDGEQVLVPNGTDVVNAGDLLAIAGTHEAVAAARELLAPARSATE